VVPHAPQPCWPILGRRATVPSPSPSLVPLLVHSPRRSFEPLRSLPACPLYIHKPAALLFEHLHPHGRPVCAIDALALAPCSIVRTTHSAFCDTYVQSGRGTIHAFPSLLRLICPVSSLDSRPACIRFPFGLYPSPSPFTPDTHHIPSSTCTAPRPASPTSPRARLAPSLSARPRARGRAAFEHPPRPVRHVSRTRRIRSAASRATALVRAAHAHPHLRPDRSSDGIRSCLRCAHALNRPARVAVRIAHCLDVHDVALALSHSSCTLSY
jgi:hypothetical protein